MSAVRFWCLVVVMAPQVPAFAYSGFLQEAGSGYAKVSISTFSSTDLFSTSGERLTFGNAEFTQRNLALYAEYGLLPFLTVGIDAPVLRLNSFDTSDTAAGLGDIAVFAKTGLELWGFHLALIVAPEFPTGSDEQEVDTEFEGIQTNLPTGDGEFNLWTRVAVSRSLPLNRLVHWLNGYASAYVGYNFRTTYSDPYAWGAHLGLIAFDRVLLQGSIEGLVNNTPVEELDPRGIFLFAEGTEYTAVGGSLGVHIPDTPVWLTVDAQHLFGDLRNIYAGTTVAAGVALDW